MLENKTIKPNLAETGKQNKDEQVGIQKQLQNFASEMVGGAKENLEKATDGLKQFAGDPRVQLALPAIAKILALTSGGNVPGAGVQALETAVAIQQLNDEIQSKDENNSKNQPLTQQTFDSASTSSMGGQTPKELTTQTKNLPSSKSPNSLNSLGKKAMNIAIATAGSAILGSGAVGNLEPSFGAQNNQTNNIRTEKLAQNTNLSPKKPLFGPGSEGYKSNPNSNFNSPRNNQNPLQNPPQNRFQSPKTTPPAPNNFQNQPGQTEFFDQDQIPNRPFEEQPFIAPQQTPRPSPKENIFGRPKLPQTNSENNRNNLENQLRQPQTISQTNPQTNLDQRPQSVDINQFLRRRAGENRGKNGIGSEQKFEPKFERITEQGRTENRAQTTESLRIKSNNGIDIKLDKGPNNTSFDKEDIGFNDPQGSFRSIGDGSFLSTSHQFKGGIPGYKEVKDPGQDISLFLKKGDTKAIDQLTKESGMQGLRVEDFYKGKSIQGKFFTKREDKTEGYTDTTREIDVISLPIREEELRTMFQTKANGKNAVVFITNDGQMNRRGASGSPVFFDDGNGKKASAVFTSVAIPTFGGKTNMAILPELTQAVNNALGTKMSQQEVNEKYLSTGMIGVAEVVPYQQLLQQAVVDARPSSSQNTAPNFTQNRNPNLTNPNRMENQRTLPNLPNRTGPKPKLW